MNELVLLQIFRAGITSFSPLLLPSLLYGFYTNGASRLRDHPLGLLRMMLSVDLAGKRGREMVRDMNEGVKVKSKLRSEDGAVEGRGLV